MDIDDTRRDILRADGHLLIEGVFQRRSRSAWWPTENHTAWAMPCRGPEEFSDHEVPADVASRLRPPPAYTLLKVAANPLDGSIMKNTLSPEMTHYITTGRCPRCDIVILDADYVRRNALKLQDEATRLTLFWSLVGGMDFTVVPSNAKVKMRGYRPPLMQCLTCNKEWMVQSLLSPPTSEFQSASGMSVRQDQAVSPEPPMPVQRKINLADCKVVELSQVEQIAANLPLEIKTYPNKSKTSTLTKEISVSNTIAREVTIESSQLRAHNAEAGITLVGFATIQGQVQAQLNQTYAVRTQSSITITEKTTIQIPPASAIEHRIRWTVISEKGLAILGKSVTLPTQSRLAEVPYQVPLRLTYTEEIIDV